MITSTMSPSTRPPAFRLFTALLLPDDAKRHIAEVQARLREIGRGNFTRVENLHLTLVFLGEIAPERLPEIRAAIDEEAAAAEPFRFTISGAGRFGDLWWLGVDPPPALEALQRGLAKGLESFARIDERPYKPHLTLAREFVSPSSSGDVLRTLEGYEPIVVPVGRISLMKSEHIGGKLTYTELYTSSLKGV